MVLPSYVAVGVLLGAATMATGGPARLAGAAASSATMYAAYLLVGLASNGTLGLGDVKLAGLLGLLLGWLGLGPWVVGAAAPFLLALPVALTGLLLRRWARDSQLPLGPFMLAGTLLAVLATAG